MKLAAGAAVVIVFQMRTACPSDRVNVLASSSFAPSVARSATVSPLWTVALAPEATPFTRSSAPAPAVAVAPDGGRPATARVFESMMLDGAPLPSPVNTPRVKR